VEEKSREDTAGGRGERKKHGNSGNTDLGPPKPTRSRGQIIVAKDNDLERLDKEKGKLQKADNGCKQRMRHIGGMLWKEGV